jgi:hypothetical protein
MTSGVKLSQVDDKRGEALEVDDKRGEALHCRRPARFQCNRCIESALKKLSDVRRAVRLLPPLPRQPLRRRSNVDSYGHGHRSTATAAATTSLRRAVRLLPPWPRQLILEEAKNRLQAGAQPEDVKVWARTQAAVYLA